MLPCDKNGRQMKQKTKARLETSERTTANFTTALPIIHIDPSPIFRRNLLEL
jgi:hypothetical protein